MSKKTLYHDKAKTHYVEDQLTYEDVATQVPVSVRTLIKWGKEGNWEVEREQYSMFKADQKERVKRIINRLGKSIEDALEENKKVSPQTLNNYDKLNKLYFKFAEEERKEEPKEADGDKGDVSDSTIKAFENMFGKKL
ncbi:MAG: hypothetical protein N4A72_14650 [Bacteroidales bacterium]|jgi:uncharacterized protein YjcR|nr:hypothetical protein [Bacteroidales bacterium]